MKEGCKDTEIRTEDNDEKMESDASNRDGIGTEEAEKPDSSDTEGVDEAEDCTMSHKEEPPVQGDARGGASKPKPEVDDATASSTGDKHLFCRSRDRKTLEGAVWGILPRLKLIDHNLKIVDASFQRLVPAAPRTA